MNAATKSILAAALLGVSLTQTAIASHAAVSRPALFASDLSIAPAAEAPKTDSELETTVVAERLRRVILPTPPREVEAGAADPFRMAGLEQTPHTSNVILFRW